jgi:ABC-type bacteriocin/lantibiotic exporter with double-glycine peptidase domain
MLSSAVRLFLQAKQVVFLTYRLEPFGIAAATFLSTVTAIFDLIQVWIFLQLLEAIQNLHSGSPSLYSLDKLYETPLATYSILLLLASLASVALKFFSSKSQITVAYNINQSISVRLFERLVDKDIMFHKRSRSGDYTSLIQTKAETMVGSSFLPAIQILGSIISIVVLLIPAWLAFGPTVLIIVPFVVLSFACVYYYVFGNIRVISKEIRDYDPLVKSFIKESFDHVYSIKIYGLRDFLSREFSRKYQKLRNAHASFYISSSIPRSISESTPSLLLALAAIILLFLNKGYILNSIQVSELSNVGELTVAAILILQKIIPHFQSLFSNAASFAAYTHSNRDVLENISYPPSFSGESDAINIHSEIETPGFCRLEISLAEDFLLANNQQPLAITSRIFKFNGPGLFLIQGKSGCGKSTLLEALTGLYIESHLMNSHRLFFNNMLITPNNLKSYLASISYASQKPFILPKSVINNIICPNELLTDTNIRLRLEKAISMAQLRELIDSLSIERCLHADIEEKRNFSGGQEKRIELARALFNDRPVLLLDEPCSGLDQTNRLQIYDNLRLLSKSKLIIFTAHSVEAEHFADEIISL